MLIIGVAMGYRSEVWIGVPNDRKEDFEKVDESNLFYLEKENDKIAIYYADWLKWYKGNFAEVDSIIEFIENIYAIGEDAFIIALGEDFALHSEIGDYSYWLDIQLKIHIGI